jgi:HAD superfamily hydrolase (TIGR01490 family)
MDLIKGIFLSLLYKLNLKDPVKIIGTMVSWVKGASESALKELSSEVFNANILKSVYPEVHSEIKFHQNEGAGIVILSSTILPVCQNLADYLGIDDMICSKLEVVNGIYSGRLVGPPCFGKEKVNRLTEYCNENNINPKDSWYYGDDISDLNILSAVGNPVCVNPDKKLKKAATRRGWKILQWH